MMLLWTSEILHEMKFRLTVSLALNCIFLDLGLNTLFKELISKGEIGNQTQSTVALIFHKIKSLSNPDVSWIFY